MGCWVLLKGNGKAVLWNPSTNESKPLPQSSVQRPPSTVRDMIYAFGLGVGLKSEDYKFVTFVVSSMKFGIQTQVNNISSNVLPSIEHNTNIFNQFSNLLIGPSEGFGVRLCCVLLEGLLSIVYPLEGVQGYFDIWVMNRSWTRNHLMDLFLEFGGHWGLGKMV
ncbi:hypothetical protein PTKIN_Ptkin05aG0053600 [Pterospermum kingtungense]